MKRFLIVYAFTCGFITFGLVALALAGDITLTTPTSGPVTTKVSVDGYRMESTSIIADVAYRTSDGVIMGTATVVLVNTCVGSSGATKAECEAFVAPSDVITGDPVIPGHPAGVWNNAYSAATNYKIAAGDVGKNVGDLLEKQIRQEVKKALNIVGTVAP